MHRQPAYDNVWQYSPINKFKTQKKLENKMKAEFKNTGYLPCGHLLLYFIVKLQIQFCIIQTF